VAEQQRWARVLELAESGRSPNADCLLELRARVEALEANSKPTPNSSQIRSSLVERVTEMVSEIALDEDTPWVQFAADITREVAAWLQDAGFWEAADALEQEADR